MQNHRIQTMAVHNRKEFRMRMEAALKTDEQRLARLRYLLDITWDQLITGPDDDYLQTEVAVLESLIEASEAKIAVIRDSLDKAR